jgi:hypothetical protein
LSSEEKSLHFLFAEDFSFLHTCLRLEEGFEAVIESGLNQTSCIL